MVAARGAAHAATTSVDQERRAMPRYLVERTACEPLALPEPGQGRQALARFVENNARDGVVWLHSHLAPDGRKSFCLYEAPGPAAIRRAAERNGLPIDRITEVRMLDPNPAAGP
jgi:hypothetical protein